MAMALAEGPGGGCWPLHLPGSFQGQHLAAIRQIQVTCGLDLQERDDKRCRTACPSSAPSFQGKNI